MKLQSKNFKDTKLRIYMYFGQMKLQSKNFADTKLRVYIYFGQAKHQSKNSQIVSFFVITKN